MTMLGQVPDGLAELAVGESGLSTAVVIDDCEFFRLAVADILYREGYFHIVEMPNIDEAVQAALPARPSLVILSAAACDPSGQGRGVQAARQRLGPRRLIVTTPVFDRPLALRILGEGAHGIVAKPLGAEDCTRAIQAVTQGRIYVPFAMADMQWAADTGADPAAQPGDPTAPLTPRQRQVLERVAIGLSNKAIARDLGLGEGTVKIHVAALFRVLGVSNRTGAAIAGLRLLGPATATAAIGGAPAAGGARRPGASA